MNFVRQHLQPYAICRTVLYFETVLKVFFFNFKICRFVMVPKSLLLNIDSKGLWSVITMRS